VTELEGSVMMVLLGLLKTIWHPARNAGLLPSAGYPAVSLAIFFLFNDSILSQVRV
jgi:hypothetical protein